MSHADDERPTTADEAAFDAELRLALEASPAAPSETGDSSYPDVARQR